MDTQLLEEKFRRMGARVKIHSGTRQRVAIDIGHDRKGEFFDLTVRRGVMVNAIDVRPRERHLLLAAHDEDKLGLPTGSGQRFLCGHDERAWFVAAVPEGRPASNVPMAMDALKPREALRAEARVGLRFGKRHRRHNAAWKRQGEWFFIPAERVAVEDDEIRRNEPLVRTGVRGSKAHIAEFCVREGGELVHVDFRTRKVLSPTQYRRLLQHKPQEAKNFLMQRRNMRVLVRGRISHDDHKTIVLHDWHEVAMNTESQSRAMRFVTFID
jgi:hypothetical protein